MLVIEHDMDFVRRFAHKVTVMHEGKILTEGTVAEVQTQRDRARGLPRPAARRPRRRGGGAGMTEVHQPVERTEVAARRARRRSSPSPTSRSPTARRR